MKLILYSILLIPTLSLAQYDETFAALNDTDKLKSGIVKMAENTTSIEASFHQKKHISVLTNTINSEGEMVFKKPTLLKWEYNSPYKYIIYFKKNEIIIDDEGKINVLDISSSKSFVEINNVIINCVSGNILQDDQFLISYYVSDNYYLTKMKPKASGFKDFINTIEVYLDKSDFTVSSVKLIETQNDYTVIDFFDKKLNETVSDEVFQHK